MSHNQKVQVCARRFSLQPHHYIVTSQKTQPSEKTPFTTLKSGTNIILKKILRVFCHQNCQTCFRSLQVKTPWLHRAFPKQIPIFGHPTGGFQTPWCHDLHCFGVSLVSDLPRSEDGFPNLCQVWGDPKCSTWYSLGLTMLRWSTPRKKTSTDWNQVTFH